MTTVDDNYNDDDTMTTRFSVFGRRLVTHVRHEGLRRWLLNHWTLPQGGGSSPFTITLVERDPAEVSDWLETARQWPQRTAPTTLPGRTLTIYQQEDRWFSGDDASGVAFEVEQDAASITVWGVDSRIDNRVNSGVDSRVNSGVDHYLLFLAIVEALRASGLVSLHAAAAATPDGQVTAFLGPSGRGKTSTLLRAVEAGWAPVSEDILWLEPDTARVYGGEKGVRLLPEVLATLPPELARRDWGAPVVDKVFVPYDALASHYHTAHQSGLELARIAVLERDPDAPVDTSYWQPLTKQKAALALWQASGLPLTRRARNTIATTIPKLLRDVDVGELHLGRTDVRDFLAALRRSPSITP